MSTIHDALKKVQDDMDRPDSSAEKTPDAGTPAKPHNPFNPPPPPAPAQTSDIPEPQKPKNTGRKIFFAFLIVIIIAGISTGGFLLAQRYDISALTSQCRFARIKKKPASVAQKTKPVSFIPKKSGLRIQGIMTVNNKHVALINNEIYEAGASVDGQHIKTITPHNVILVSPDGQEQTLDVPK